MPWWKEKHNKHPAVWFDNQDAFWEWRDANRPGPFGEEPKREIWKMINEGDVIPDPQNAMVMGEGGFIPAIAPHVINPDNLNPVGLRDLQRMRNILDEAPVPAEDRHIMNPAMEIVLPEQPDPVPLAWNPAPFPIAALNNIDLQPVAIVEPEEKDYADLTIIEKLEVLSITPGMPEEFKLAYDYLKELENKPGKYNEGWNDGYEIGVQDGRDMEREEDDD